MLITGTDLITEKRVTDVIRDDDSLSHLKEKYGLGTLIAKVRTERKKHFK